MFRFSVCFVRGGGGKVEGRRGGGDGGGRMEWEVGGAFSMGWMGSGEEDGWCCRGVKRKRKGKGRGKLR